MPRRRGIDMFDQGGKRRGFSRSGWSGYDDHARSAGAPIAQKIGRHAKFVHGWDLRPNVSQNSSSFAEPPVKIGAEPLPFFRCK